MPSFNIEKYSVVLSSTGEYGWIMVFEAPPGSRRARLNFSNDSPTSPTVNGDFISVRMKFSMLSKSVDILRNEGPVSLFYSTHWGGLATGDEPVGDGDIDNP